MVRTSTITDSLAELNAQQREAVIHGIDHADDRALLIIAGAGSGKTKTLAHRVAHLIRRGADPQRILLLTFSRRAAQEMQSRVSEVLSSAMGLTSLPRSGLLPWAGTFHAVGARLLRDLASRIELSESFTIHDRGDSEDLLGMLRHDLSLDATKTRFPLKGTCLAIYSRVVNSREPLDAVLHHTFPWCEMWFDALARLFEAYVAAKQDQQILDYDDLLLYWREVMQIPKIADDLRAKFDHVLVDEYQDSNSLQADILLALKPSGRGLTVVGDDAQAIYSFRAATVRNILDFPNHFPVPGRVLTLEQNYRCTQPILDASNAVIAQAPDRYAKVLWTQRPGHEKPKLVTVSDESGQARWVADQVLAAREAGHRLISQAVLFRASQHSAPLELELVRRNIPFVKFGGLKFLESVHIKDILSLLRFAQNPLNRIAGFRILQRLPGLGPVKAARLLDAWAIQAGAGSVNVAVFMAQSAPAGVAREDWDAFSSMFSQICARGMPWPADLDLAIAWYRPRMEQFFDDARVRWGDLEQLAMLAPAYGDRVRFLTELTLDPPDATSDESGIPLKDEDYLILSTIHSAKGQEWKAVYVLNAVDGCIPSDLSTGDQDEIAEERRLLYVAMTRAKQTLQIVVPQRFYVTQQTGQGDRHVYGGRTRFIDDSMLPLFDRLPEAPPLPDLPARLADRPATVDIAKRIGAIWKKS